MEEENPNFTNDRVSTLEVKVETPQEKTSIAEERPASPRKPSFGLIISVICVIIFGIGTGFVLARKSTVKTSETGGSKIIKTEKEQGSTNTQFFSDTATGIIQKNPGTTSSEGTHMLIRNPGDQSQTAYLTSSVVDLDQFVGKKVQVWGKTFKSQQAAWLMDVGRVKLVE